jgi:hypothetical protein
LHRELLRPGSGLAAVMAGRGMGKTSFARQLCAELRSSTPDLDIVYWPQTPNDASDFLLKLAW